MAFHWFGSPGNNTVTGRLNDSNLFANFGRGTDSLTGGNRSDTFFLAVDQHRDHIDGGKGIDTVDYSAADRGLTIDLQQGLTIAKFHGDLIVNPGPGGGYIDPIVDKIVTDLRNVENVVGSNYDDVIVGNHGRNVLTGGNGADTFVFNQSCGNDTITDFKAGGPDHDVLQFSQVFKDYNDLLNHAENHGHDVVIHIDDHNSVTLLNTHVSDLHQNDFSFV